MQQQRNRKTVKCHMKSLMNSLAETMLFESTVYLQKIKVHCQPSSAPDEEFVSELGFVIAQFKAAEPHSSFPHTQRKRRIYLLPPLYMEYKGSRQVLENYANFFPTSTPETTAEITMSKHLLALTKTLIASWNALDGTWKWNQPRSSRTIFKY